MAEKKGGKGLGKGLGALFGDMTPPTDEPQQPDLQLPLQKIEPNPNQPERTLTRRSCRRWPTPSPSTASFNP